MTTYTTSKRPLAAMEIYVIVMTFIAIGALIAVILIGVFTNQTVTPPVFSSLIVASS